jgi:STE24 endopeptidase
VQAALAAALLVLLLVSGGAAALRDLSGGAPGAYALLLVLALELAVLPVAWQRTYEIERQFGRIRASIGQWGRDYASGVALTTLAAVPAAELLYRSVRLWPDGWWLPAAAGAIGLATLATWVAPVVILPIFQAARPLARDDLRERLTALGRRTGVDLPPVYESRSAPEAHGHASMVGIGSTRRILLSSSLLADYADDEIEAVVAHEVGHQVHRDTLWLLGAHFLVLLGGLWAAWAALRSTWQALGLMSPADVAGLPLLLVVAGSVRLLAMPCLNGLSRWSERRADRFALGAVARPEAFIGAVCRMAAQHLVEERPSRLTYWLFHRHPTVEERVAMARQHRPAQITEP